RPAAGSIGCIDYFICTEPKDTMFPWEDPLPRYYPKLIRLPSGPIANIRAQMADTFSSALIHFDQFPLGSLALLSLLAMVIGINVFWNKPGPRFIRTWTVMIIILQMSGYIATGYVLLQNERIEVRYHLTLVPLLAVTMFWLVQEAYQRLQERG